MAIEAAREAERRYMEGRGEQQRIVELELQQAQYGASLAVYPKGERGRRPIGLERMLRLYFMQQWYGLADEALEDALYDSQALRGSAGIDLAVESVPDATTVLHFRH
jgi:Transposase domain (DUF772)